MQIKNLLSFFLFLIIIFTTSCNTYRFRYFRTDAEIIKAGKTLDSLDNQQDAHYKIQKRDYIELRLFTNEGEAIIAPSGTADEDLQNNNNNFGLNNGLNNGLGGNGQLGLNGQNGGLGTMQILSEQRFPLQYPSFLVQNDGTLRLPKVGFINVEGLTLTQVDSLLEIKYSKFYEGAFVRSRFLNKRIKFFDGHDGQLLPLQTEKMTLTEIIAMTGGLKRDRRYDNIRWIRGDLKDPDFVKVIDYTTITSASSHNLVVKPDDIIYIQPIRKTFLETLQDISPILSLVTASLTLIVLLRN